MCVCVCVCIKVKLVNSIESDPKDLYKIATIPRRNYSFQFVGICAVVFL